MDSGNSSSMQSSSGGDEQEYDSRSLFHHHNNNINMIMKPPPPPPQQQQEQQGLNWAPPPPLLSFTTGASEPPQKKAAGPSKKRTRASRRAPTTVLSTDTTNFRAMVQEFTGIPDPPFSSSRRLDLLSTAGSSMRLAGPFRPAPQRLPPTSLYGSGQSDQTLAFQSLIQQPLLFPPPFGMNMGGGLMSAMDPPLPGNGLGFLSSSQPDHGGTNNPNNNYITSQENAEYHNN